MSNSVLEVSNKSWRLSVINLFELAQVNEESNAALRCEAAKRAQPRCCKFCWGASFSQNPHPIVAYFAPKSPALTDKLVGSKSEASRA